MSNSQNTENEQQNNLCTTLTEQLKKGELKVGWYYITTTFADGIFMEWFDGDEFRVVFTCNVKEVLAPIPSYEEWRRLQSSWVDEMGKAVDLQKALEWSNEQYNTKVPVLESENQQLKELLKECKTPIDLLIKMNIDGINGYKLLDLLTKIDNAIGDK